MSRLRPRRLQIEGATFICSVRPLRDPEAVAVVFAAHGAGRHLRLCFRSGVVWPATPGWMRGPCARRRDAGSTCTVPA